MNNSYFGFSENSISGSSGIGIGIRVSLNLSDTNIYNVATRTLTVPLSKKYADIFDCTADLYVAIKVYAIDDIIVSDGSEGGEIGKFYKSITSGNTGNLLSDAGNWAFADLAGDNIGNIEIVSFGNPISLSKFHNSQFETAAQTSITFIPTPVDTPIATGQIMLPINTPITIVGRSTVDDIISFNVQNSIARWVGQSVN